MRWSLAVLLAFASAMTLAQEDRLHADFRREGERVADACQDFSFHSVPGCAYELFTDHPLHIAAGSMPPQNGFALGPAFVADKHTTDWRLTWDVDAVASSNASWRAGGYMKLIHTPPEQIHVIVPSPGNATETKPAPKRPSNLVHPFTVFNLYAQSISLNKINFYGLGINSTPAGASVFGMTQTIVGGSAVKPVFEWPAIRKLNLALLGEINGRFVNLRGEYGQSFPSIEALYTNATAPGLSSQPGFFQLGEGVRIKPRFGDHWQLNYLANFQQFFAPSNSQSSFLRWTTDLNHTFDVYGSTQSAPADSDTNGPDHCAPTSEPCPPLLRAPSSRSHNLNGSVNLRLLLSESITSGTSAVPFYFQPTLGGSDIDGAPSLGSYQDYRFRAPNILLLQENVEHSIWGPFGFRFLADQGTVSLTRGDLGFSHLKHSFATGLTLRAGGFPMVNLMFAWGGNEGDHTIFNMNNALLGASSRPSLY
ncbi:MAG: hypothetical protein ABSD75_10220 [Terriglobales bacterium]|jgi:hypothetical protein